MTKRIIGHKTYNTETSVRIAENLFLTRDGLYFTIQEFTFDAKTKQGYPLSAYHLKQLEKLERMMTHVTPLTKEEAQKLFPNLKLPSPVRSLPECRFSLRISGLTAKRFKNLAKSKKISVSRFIELLIEKELKNNELTEREETLKCTI
tara:strand:- start:29 stop:472 length:444 start_codon:yes stop_codon:yes gene_type:complete